MAGPDDPRRSRPEDEDLFEDLDQFFAPLGDTDWPEGARDSGEPGSGPPEAPDPPELAPPPAAGPPPGDETTPGDDWNVDIDVPDEADLLAPPADASSEAAPAAPGEPPAEVPTPAADLSEGPEAEADAEAEPPEPPVQVE
ncbi:MAG TPA: hypothetical protein VHH92_03655, partial [Actinomycetota bacterium]|nr:hypothetical protein [Actinomycetota bacterium]